jgi:hypothetical protein
MFLSIYRIKIPTVWSVNFVIQRMANAEIMGSDCALA